MSSIRKKSNWTQNTLSVECVYIHMYVYIQVHFQLRYAIEYILCAQNIKPKVLFLLVVVIKLGNNIFIFTMFCFK